MKKPSPVTITGLVLTILCTAFYVSGSAFVQALSNYAYDAFLRRVAKDPVSGRVAIVDLDETSLAKYGQWPWSRYLVAELTQRILDAKAAVVAFDVVFAEKDRTSPSTLQEAINKHFGLNIRIQGVPEKYENFDKMFADVIRDENVILGCFMNPGAVEKGEVLDNMDPYFTCHFFSRSPPGVRVAITNWLMPSSGITLAIPELCEVSHTAFFNAVTDADSIVRSNPLVWGLGDRIYPSLAMEAIRLYCGAAQCYVEFDEQGIVDIRMRDVVIPTDLQGRLIVHYRTVNESAKTGFLSSFPTYTADEVLRGNVGEAELGDKIVFVGTSAIGLKDVKASPLTQFFSGVEVHATIVDNILAGDILKRPSWMIGVDVVSIVLMGLFLTAFIAKGRSWLSFLISTAMILLVIKISIVLISRYCVVFVPAWLILSIVIIYPVLTMLKFWQEELQKKRVRDMFGTMVSANVLHYLENNPGSFSLTGQKAEATMFFSDVAGFTTISENLVPEKLSELLNRYLSPMTEIIMNRGGYVDKYEGDLIMAEWGVPYPMHDHATQACLSALEQQQKLAELRPALRDEFGHELYVRMGINSGSITAGNMGSDKRFQYTVMGDAVNQAARFEPANKDYATTIIIGETTYEHAKDSIEARLLDKIVVKGKTLPICIYELVAQKGSLQAEKVRIMRLYDQALRLHWERRWSEAIVCLEQALRLDEQDGPSAKLLSRVVWYRDNPPGDTWAGEYVRTAKD